MIDFEKLGVFYLGRVYHQERGEVGEEPLLYDSKDLTTHGLIVGMTGSGKTGLAVDLLEEAAIDGIPALVIDPKGDMGNLALRFPDLREEDFLPWIESTEAVRAGLTREALAQQTAERWREGLAAWGQAPERIRRFAGAAEVAIYTPGSGSGRALAVLKSFAAPSPEVRANEDALRERVTGTASALLGLVGVDADPLTSREHILVAHLLDRAWRAGEASSLPSLVARVKDPPFERLGALALADFYPKQERSTFATRLNSLLASPAFAAWREGEPLDVQRLLYDDAGRPRISILSIAHLSDRERMFFVTLLLEEVVAWMRRLEGTGSLRALLYMDEIYGFFPPVAAPPSKGPMITLLKQARAYGLGVVLATQNPVDLDYKGLANIGTWFLGRLQTVRDRDRLLDGLDTLSSGGALDRAEASRLISSLDPRVFLMHDVHEDRPTLFQSRWALSYLRGPMTLDQIRGLREAPEGTALPTREPPPPPPPPIAAIESRPRLPESVPEWFLDDGPSPGGTPYRPGLVSSAHLHYASAKDGLDGWEKLHLWTPLGGEGPPDWSCSERLAALPPEGATPETGASFTSLPEAATREKSYESWRGALATFLYREHPLVLHASAEPKAISRPEETEAAFRARLVHLAREQRDRAVEALRRELAPKLERLKESVRRAETRLDKESSQYGSSALTTAVDFGMTLAGALFGRKLASVANARRASRAARSGARALREREDRQRAEEALAEEREKLEALEEELRSRTEALSEIPSPDTFALEKRSIRPKKSDISIEALGIGWRRP